VVQVKTQSLSLAVLLCFYVIFVFSINPFMTNFPGMSFEVTDQNNEGVFSSLSRNFEQTVEDINNADEKSTTSTSSSSSTDSSNNADEKSTTSNVPIAAFDSSNLISSNSTTSGDLEKNNETGSIK
jgi:hypothetical protein